MRKLADIIKNTNVSNDILRELLNSLGYKDMYGNPNERIPDNVYDSIIDICNDGNLLSVLKLENSTYNDNLQKDYITKDDNEEDEYENFIPYKIENTENSFYNVEIPSFCVDELYIKTNSNNISTIKLFDTSNIKQEPYFSVLIGPNGVGKSSILRDIVNFFVEIENLKNNDIKRTLYKGLLVGIRYHLDNQEYCVVKTKVSFLLSINRKISKLEQIKLPIIVACHYGAFDKFPRQTINSSKISKYDISTYKYVGAYVNGNVISIPSILFRLLFTLTEHIDDNSRVNICSLLNFINYDTKISLQYSIVSKSNKYGDIYNYIARNIDLDREFKFYSTKEKSLLASSIYNFYKRKLSIHKSELYFDFNKDSLKDSNKNRLNYLYKLKQYNLINSVHVWFYKHGEKISSEEISSGELIMLSAILSISAIASNNHTLILFDEPELSQHPNWQMSIIENLDKALFNQKCHTILATHSHMLVSDLPQNRSSVIQLDKTNNSDIKAEILTSSTYGWSAEEVLLKVFKTATDRNRYFGERISKLLEQMGNNTILPDDVVNELCELEKISRNLSDIDPMKSVLNTIIQAYKK